MVALHDLRMMIFYNRETSIIVPPVSPYEAGAFFYKIHFPSDYPFWPPKCTFFTIIYHPNINSEGFISLVILWDQWRPALNITKVLSTIRSLLKNPNPTDPLVPDIAYLFIDDRAKFDEIAKQWTKNMPFE